MVKLVALYGYPEDVVQFEQHYKEVHIPLTRKMPGLQKIELTRFTTTPVGEKSPYYMQASLYFNSREELDYAMMSPEGKAAAKDIWKLAGHIMTMIIGDVTEEVIEEVSV